MPPRPRRPPGSGDGTAHVGAGGAGAPPGGNAPLTTRLFVYGTLAPGHDAWGVLEPWVVGDGEADAVAGSLYDTGHGYPAAIFGTGTGTCTGDGLVHGVVVMLDPERVHAALDALDRYEGDQYTRITVRTVAGTDAQTYVWIAGSGGHRLVADGRWAGAPHAAAPRVPTAKLHPGTADEDG